MKSTETSLSRSESLLKFVHEIAQAGLEYPQIVQTVAPSIYQITGDLCVITIKPAFAQLGEPITSTPIEPAIKHTLFCMLEALAKEQTPSVAPEELEKGAWTHTTTFPDEAMPQTLQAAQGVIKDAPISAVMHLPLRTQTLQMGEVWLVRFRPQSAFSEQESVIYQDMVDLGALAIENARLYALEAQRARELDALHTATSALLTSLELDVLLGKILDAAMKAIPTAEHGELHLLSRDTGKLELRAFLGYKDPRIKSIRSSSIAAHTLQVLQTRHPLLLRDISGMNAAQIAGNPDEAGDFSSVVAAPIILGEDVLGVIALSSGIKNAFSESDMRLLVSFAATTTAALRNAQLHAEMQKLAITDSLTGLYNRRGFYEIGRREIERARRFKHPLSAIMIDVDHFKQINDRYGHIVGDRVLIALAQNLQNVTRSVDILCRYGGDEFAILLPETDLYTAINVAERLRQCAAEVRITIETGVVHFTISLGVSKATADTQDLSSVLEKADTALYFAKQRGRNRVEVQ